MNKTLLVLSLFLAISFGSSGQTTNPVPKVSSPIYFDVSPALRDMVKKQPPSYKIIYKEREVKNFFNIKKQKAELPADFTDPVAQGYNGKTTTTDTTLQNFEGTPNVQGYVPPDTHGDVGPNHYFQIVNCQYSIYDKSGNLLLGPLYNTTIWDGMPNNYDGGDGVVLYDEQADRWLITQLSYNSSMSQNWLMVAVSQTADPTGTWYRYEFALNSTLPDYPKYAIWPDGYYVGYNQFANGASYSGIGASAIDRAAMIAGNSTAQMVTFSLPSSNAAFTTLPSDCDGAFPPSGTPNYFVYMNSSPSYLGIYQFHVDWNTPANSTFGNYLQLPVSSFNSSISNIPQKGTNQKLDAITDRLMYRLQYRKFSDHESMVCNHTVNVGSNVAGIRWYELRKTAGDWSVYQESTYSPDNNCRWMGSIAMDSAGNIALGYSVSSSSMFPSVRFAGRYSGDTLNKLTIAEKNIIDGGGSQTGANRWGDYSMMSVDPSSPTVFWYTQEYYAANSGNGWKTRIASFSFKPPLACNAKANPSKICQGKTSHLAANASGGSHAYTYLWTSNPPGFTDTIPNPVVNPSDTTKYYLTVNDGINTTTDSVMVTVVTLPVVFAGNDTTVCMDITQLELDGTATNQGSIIWLTSGDGTFSDIHALQTIYYPGAGDKANGSFTVTLKAFPALPCNTPVLSPRTVTFSPCNGVGSITRDLMVNVQPNPSHGVFNLSVNGLSDPKVKVEVLDLSGKTVFTSVYATEDTRINRTIDLSGLAKNIYILKITTDSRSHLSKIVID